MARPGTRWVLCGGGCALGPLVGSCRAGLLWFDVVCQLSLMKKVALLMLLKRAVAIQVGSRSWFRYFPLQQQHFERQQGQYIQH